MEWMAIQSVFEAFIQSIPTSGIYSQVGGVVVDYEQ